MDDEQAKLATINERWFSDKPLERPELPPGWFYPSPFSDWVVTHDRSALGLAWALPHNGEVQQ